MFGLLVDLPESDKAEDEFDGYTLGMIASAIRELNEDYGEKFFACVRRRTENPDGKFCGRERKRGAVCDLAEATETGDSKEFRLVCGNIYGAKYIVCLDADTRPGIGSIGRTCCFGLRRRRSVYAHRPRIRGSDIVLRSQFGGCGNGIL